MAKMKMPTAKIHADEGGKGSLGTGTFDPWNINIKRKCFENFMSQYVGISKHKIAIISLGKMPNG